MGRLLQTTIWIFALVAALAACGGPQPETPASVQVEGDLHVESSAFRDGDSIPQRYTCDGEDTSPPLSWSEPPPGTQSLALICDDPDAPGGIWVHWVLFNLPAASRSLPEAVPPDETIAGGAMHGSNSWGRLGYGGPCPPQGPPHRYVFTVYALDTTLNLGAGATKKEVETAVQDHILAQGELTRRYGR